MRLAIALSLAVAVACGSTEPSDGVTGVYSLQTVNGKALPSESPVGSGSILFDASLTIDASGTWHLIETRNLPSAGYVDQRIPVEYVGTWTRSGSLVTFVGSHAPSEYVYSAKLDGRTLTLIRLDTLVYRR